MKYEVRWTDLADDCFPEELMMGEKNEALNRRIQEKVMEKIRENKGSRRSSAGKTVRIVALVAALALLFTATAYASGLFRQKLSKASGTVSGQWVWRNEDGSVEVQKMEYPDAGYILTAEDTGSIPNQIELKANWLPSRTEQVGKWTCWLRDDGGMEGPIPYQVNVYYALPGLTLVMNGTCEIVKEETWDGYQVTKLTAAWNLEYGLGVQNFILMKDETRGFILSVGGGDDFETLEHIARELEVRDTGRPVEYNPDINIGIMNIGRG